MDRAVVELPRRDAQRAERFDAFVKRVGRDDAPQRNLECGFHLSAIDVERRRPRQDTDERCDQHGTVDDERVGQAVNDRYGVGTDAEFLL
jgi:hypothetical protein